MEYKQRIEEIITRIGVTPEELLRILGFTEATALAGAYRRKFPGWPADDPITITVQDIGTFAENNGYVAAISGNPSDPGSLKYFLIDASYWSAVASDFAWKYMRKEDERDAKKIQDIRELLRRAGFEERSFTVVGSVGDWNYKCEDGEWRDFHLKFPEINEDGLLKVLARLGIRVYTPAYQKLYPVG